MLTDIEIAQQAKMKKIGEIAANLGIEEDEVEQYGHYKAKLNQNLFNRLADKPDGKLILVPRSILLRRARARPPLR